MSLGGMIRSKREERDLTQQELADILRVTRQTVSRWESGRRWPKSALAIMCSHMYRQSVHRM